MTSSRLPYRVPIGISGSELRQKGSRFVAIVEPVDDEQAARRRLQELASENTDATHVCWAWRIGQPPREARSDAGEPSGTAGTPMLRVLQGRELSNVLAVVIRWFGGVKLGRGGLARAYAKAVREALEGLPTELRTPTVVVEVRVPYGKFGEVRKWVRPPEVEIVSQRYADEEVDLVLEVASPRLNGLLEACASLGAEVTSVGD